MLDKERVMKLLEYLAKDARSANEIKVEGYLNAIRISLLSGKFDKKKDTKDD